MMNSYFGQIRRTPSFSEIFPSADEFLAEWKTSPLWNSFIPDDDIKKLWAHLIAAYGNSHIASSDKYQFKAKVWSIISTKGLTWSKRLYVINKLLNLSDKDILKNSKSWVNMAESPMGLEDGVNGNGNDAEFLDFIQNQNVSFTEKGELEAYTNYIQALGIGVRQTEEFVNNFKKLFMVVVDYEDPLYYISENYEDEV